MLHKTLLKSLNVLLLLIMISVFIILLILRSKNYEVKFMGGQFARIIWGGKKLVPGTT